MSIEKARCDTCPLGEMWRRKGEFSPVPAEIHASDKIVFLGEAPGSHEVFEGRPFVGPSGMELQSALDEIGVERAQCQINNVIADMLGMCDVQNHEFTPTDQCDLEVVLPELAPSPAPILPDECYTNRERRPTPAAGIFPQRFRSQFPP